MHSALTPTQWQRRKRQEAEQHTLDRYPPEQRWALYDEACDLRDKLERALTRSTVDIEAMG